MSNLKGHIIPITIVVIAALNVSSFAQSDAFGVHASEILNIPFPTLESIARILDSANVRWIRVVIAWRDVEPVQGQWDWGDLENRFALLKSYNINTRERSSGFL